MTISIICALGDNDAIGIDNHLPWTMPADLKRFRALTMGHHVLMGRRTWDEIRKPLPGRVNVVITRDPKFGAEGAAIARSVDQALAEAEASGDAEIFVIGGAQIIAQVLHLADRMYLTRVHAEPAADTFFPEFDDVNEWVLADREDFEADEKNPFAYSFLTYERVGEVGRPVAFDEQG